MQTLALAFLLLAWLNGLHIGPWVSWHSELLVFVAIGCGALGVLSQKKWKVEKSISVPYGALIWPLLGMVSALQLCFGLIDFHGDVVLLAFYFGIIFAAMVWGHALGIQDESVLSWTDRNMLSQMACVLLIGAIVSTFMAWIQTLDVWLDVEWIARSYSLRRPGGNINQSNQLATLQLMGVVSLAYLFERRVVRGMAALLMYGVLIAGVGLTESRTAIISAVALAGFGLAFRKKFFGGRAATYAVGGVCMLIVCFRILPVSVHGLLQVGSTSVGVLPANISAGSRLLIWPQLVEASLMHPWFGWGLLQVSKAHNAVLHHYQVGEAFTYAHSVILDLILGLGYPLAFLIMVLVGIWLVKRMREIQDLSSWYCMALLIPFAVHSLFEFPFAYAYFLLPAGLAIGVLEARLAPQSVVRVSWKYAVGATGLVMGLLLWSVLEYIQIEEDFRVGRMEVARIGKTPASYVRPTPILFDHMGAMLTGIRLVPVPGMDAKTIELARKVAMRFPWIATQNRYALILALNSNPDESKRQLKVIRAMHGEKTYAGIKVAWNELANSRFPQLLSFAMP